MNENDKNELRTKYGEFPPDVVEGALVANLRINTAKKQRHGRGCHLCFFNIAIGSESQAEVFYKSKKEEIKKALEGGGVSENTVRAVLNDYLKALQGDYIHQEATPEQMEEVLRKIPKLKAYNLDKVGFLLGVYWPYLRNCEILQEWKNNTDTEEKKEEFLKYTMRTNGDFRALAFGSLLARDYIQVEEEGTTNRLFWDWVDFYAEVGAFCLLYYIGREALNYSSDLLARIPAPEGVRLPIEYAELHAQEMSIYLEGVREEVEKVFSATTAEEIAEAKEKATEAVEKLKEKDEKEEAVEEAKPLPPQKIPQGTASLLSRNIEGNRTGELVFFTLPYLTRDYLLLNPDKYPNVEFSPYDAQKAIAGIMEIVQERGIEEGEDNYKINTSFYEIAKRGEGYEIDNETIKKYGLALEVLDNLYLKFVTKEGLVAESILHIQRFGLTGETRGKLVLLLNKTVFGDKKYQLIDRKTLAEIRKGKGQAWRQFVYQIINKTNKEEEAFLNDVFGYDYKIKEAKELVAEGLAEEELIRKRLEYIQKHKANDKRQLIKFFAKVVNKGLVESWEVRPNSKGKVIYSWIKKKTTTDKAEEVTVPEEGENTTQ